MTAVARACRRWRKPGVGSDDGDHHPPPGPPLLPRGRGPGPHDARPDRPHRSPRLRPHPGRGARPVPPRTLRIEVDARCRVVCWRLRHLAASPEVAQDDVPRPSAKASACDPDGVRSHPPDAGALRGQVARLLHARPVLQGREGGTEGMVRRQEVVGGRSLPVLPVGIARPGRGSIPPTPLLPMRVRRNPARNARRGPSDVRPYLVQVARSVSRELPAVEGEKAGR